MGTWLGSCAYSLEGSVFFAMKILLIVLGIVAVLAASMWAKFLIDGRAVHARAEGIHTAIKRWKASGKKFNDLKLLAEEEGFEVTEVKMDGKEAISIFAGSYNKAPWIVTDVYFVLEQIDDDWSYRQFITSGAL